MGRVRVGMVGLLGWTRLLGRFGTLSMRVLQAPAANAKCAFRRRRPRPSRRVAIGLFGLALTIAGISGMAASTSQWVSILARVEERPPTIVKHVLTEPGITQAEVDAITQASSGLTGCLQADADFPF